MVAFAVQGFVGAMPAKDPRQIPETTAVAAINMRPGSGALESIRAPRLLADINDATRCVFRIPTGDPSDLATGYWMEFTDPYTDVFRTPVVNDSYQRYYWASPSTGFKYATKAQILAGGSAAGLNAGVPRPATPVTLDIIAGTGATNSAGENTAPRVTRSYIVTFVTEYGEEGAPSPPAEATGPSDADWRLRDIPQPVTGPGNSVVNAIRIYRTVTGVTGETNFYRVVDLSIGTTIYLDRKSDLLITQNPILDADLADAPPPMDGLALMPNGVFVGFKDNNLYFSVNYKPHSWPVAYQVTVPHPIVGLAVFGSTCVVLTNGNPSFVTGNNGATMTLSNYDTAVPCLARESIVVAPEGVYWAAPDGLALWAPGSLSIVTTDTIRRDDWQTIYDPRTLEGAMVFGSYTGIRNGASATPTGFTFPGGGTIVEYTAYAPSPSDKLRLITDVWTGKVLIIRAGLLWEWIPSNGTDLTGFRWRSKVFQTPKPVSMGAAVAYTDGGSVQLRVWARGQLVFDQLVSNGRIVRLPAGFKSDLWQVEVQGSDPVHKVMVGQTIDDLKRA